MSIFKVVMSACEIMNRARLGHAGQCPVGLGQPVGRDAENQLRRNALGRQLLTQRLPALAPVRVLNHIHGAAVTDEHHRHARRGFELLQQLLGQQGRRSGVHGKSLPAPAGGQHGGCAQGQKRTSTHLGQSNTPRRALYRTCLRSPRAATEALRDGMLGGAPPARDTAAIAVLLRGFARPARQRRRLPLTGRPQRHCPGGLERNRAISVRCLLLAPRCKRRAIASNSSRLRSNAAA